MEVTDSSPPGKKLCPFNRKLGETLGRTRRFGDEKNLLSLLSNTGSGIWVEEKKLIMRSVVM